MRFRVKLGLSKKKDSEKIDLGESTHDKIAADAVTFTNVNPSLPDYKTGFLEYRTAYENALLGGKPLKAILRIKRAAFIDLLKQMKAYVDNIANGDASIITAAGFDTNSTPVSRTMTKVTGVTGSTGQNSGEANLEWSLVDGCKMYLVYAKPVGDTVAAYVVKVRTTRGHAIINGLSPGVMYELTVEACGSGTNNIGPLSDAVQIRAQF